MEDNDVHDDHPHYRYNHYPQRSSSSYSSSNLSSYHRIGGKSSPTTLSTESTATASSSTLSSPSNKHVRQTEHDDYSIQSVLSLYQAFASISDSVNKNGANQNNLNYNTYQHTTDEETTTTSNYIGDINESQNGSNSSSAAATNNNGVSPSDSGDMSLTWGSNAQTNNDENPDENNDEVSSWTSSISSPTNTLLSYSNFINRHWKRLGIATVLSLLAYSQYKKSKQRHHRRYYRRQAQKYARLVGVYRWIIQLISPFRIARHIQRTITIWNKKQIQSTLTTSQQLNNAATTPLSHLLAMAKAGNITKVMLRGSVLSYFHSMQSSSSTSSPQRQRWSQTTIPSQNPSILNEVISTLLSHGCDDITTLPESLWQRFLKGPAVMALPFAYLIGLYWMMRRLQRQQLDGEGDDWKNRGGSGIRHITTFDDVAGIDSSLQELSEIISYLRNPEAFHTVGAQPPRGVLLYGPAGSGKTLLARAIAGEAERSADGTYHIGGNTIDCFAVCSGSDFVETYVGRGAARVRSLFRNVREEALRNFKQRRQRRRIERWNTDDCIEDRAVGKQVMTRAMSQVWESMQSIVTPFSKSQEEDGNQKPVAIIFIDEIDALAKKRDSGIVCSSSLGGCDEREQTLNQLLTEMDGFSSGSSSVGVNTIVIAATNRPEVLDPAIMRAGRFDRHVRVKLPDASGREAILRVHARGVRCLSSVDFGELPTHNFSGADLKNVINEAALLAVRSGSSVVTQEHLFQAVGKVRAIKR